MPRLTVAMAVGNEASRYLRPVLEAVRPWADCLVVLDDCSSDGSGAIAREFADVWERTPERLFPTEWRLRQRLWDMAVATAPDWIGVLDADEWFEPSIADELDVAMASGARVLAYRRYDLWGDLQHYRSDEMWNAHERLTPFAVRFDPHLKQVWQQTNQHCGNFPVGWVQQSPTYVLRARMAHVGWVRPEDQRSKHDRFRALDATPDARGALQYASILDEHPHVEPWPGAPVWTPSHGRPRVELRDPVLTVTSPIRQTPAVLRAFLDGLDRLDPCGQQVRYAFIDDCADPAASALLLDWADHRPAEVLRALPADQPNPYARGEHHHWSAMSCLRVGEMRTRLMQSALEHNALHMLMVDSDIVLRPDTLRWMLAADKPVISEVMWTRYFPFQKHKHPNVWAWGDDTFWPGIAGESVEPLVQYERWIAFYRMLRRPGVYQVGGLGAVTLFQRTALQDVFAHGGYNPLPCSASVGEDRWFCTRAHVLGYSLWADTHAEPLHLYRDTDLRRLRRWWREVEPATAESS